MEEIASQDESATIERAMKLFRETDDFYNARKLLKGMNQTQGVGDAIDRLKGLVSEGELRRLGQLRAALTSFLPDAIGRTRAFVNGMHALTLAVSNEASSLLADIDRLEKEAEAIIASLPVELEMLDDEPLNNMILQLDAVRMVPSADKNAALLRQERGRRVEEHQIIVAAAFESEGKVEEAIEALQACSGAKARAVLVNLLLFQTKREQTKRMKEAMEFFEKGEPEKAMVAIMSIKDKDAECLRLHEQISHCLLPTLEMTDLVHYGQKKKAKGAPSEFFVYVLDSVQNPETFSLNWGNARGDVFSFSAASQPSLYGTHGGPPIQLGSTFVCALTKGWTTPIIMFIGKRKSNGHIGFLIGDAGSDEDRSVVMADPTKDTFPQAGTIEMSVISKTRFKMLRERALAKILFVKPDVATPHTPDVKEELDDDFDIGSRRGRGGSLWSPSNAGRAELNVVELQLLTMSNQRGDEALANAKNLSVLLANAKAEVAKMAKEHKADLVELRDDYRKQLTASAERYDALVRQLVQNVGPVGRQPPPAPRSPSPQAESESVSAGASTKATTKAKQKRGGKKASKDSKKAAVPAKREKDGGGGNGESDIELALSDDDAHVSGCMCDACQTNHDKSRLKKKTKK